MVEIPCFHTILSTFHKFGNSEYKQLSNFWNGQLSPSFQNVNVWKYFIGNAHKFIESGRNEINPLDPIFNVTTISTQRYKITPGCK